MKSPVKRSADYPFLRRSAFVVVLGLANAQHCCDYGLHGSVEQLNRSSDKGVHTSDW